MIKLRSSWKRMNGSSYASIIIRLAMVANDLSNAYLLLGFIKDHAEGGAARNFYPPIRQMLEDNDLRTGLQTYAFRVLIGHFREGVKVVREIMKKEQNDSGLRAYLQRLSPDASHGYETLKLFFTDAAQEDKFFRLIRDLRDQVGFHYGDEKRHIENTIDKLSRNDETSVNSIVDTHDARTSRFPVADVVVTNAIAMYIWKVEQAQLEDTEEAINTALAWCNEKCNLLLRFAVEMCRLFFSDNYAV